MSSGWPMVPLGQLLTHYREYIEAPEPRPYPKLSVKLYGKGVVLDPPTDGSTLRMKRHQLANAGQVILSEIWGKKGAIGFVPPDGQGALCTSHFFLFDVNRERLEPRWLEYIFKANYLQEQLDSEAKGTTGYAAVRPAHLLKATIPLPPMDEQRLIVAKIEALAAKVAEARRLRKEAGVEVDAFSHSHLNKLYAAYQLSHGVIALEDVCLSITDGAHLTPTFAERGVKFIFVGNVSSGHLHFDACKYVAPEYYKSIAPTRKPQQGDILYSAVGATLGIPALVGCDHEFCFQRHIAIIKPERSKLNSRFLWYMLRSGTLFRRAWSAITGTAQPTVPLKAIRVMPVPLPPLSEQLRAVSALDELRSKLDVVHAHQRETGSQLAALQAAILDRAFKGGL